MQWEGKTSQTKRKSFEGIPILKRSADFLYLQINMKGNYFNLKSCNQFNCHWNTIILNWVIIIVDGNSNVYLVNFVLSKHVNCYTIIIVIPF